MLVSVNRNGDVLFHALMTYDESSTLLHQQINTTNFKLETLGMTIYCKY